MCSSDLRGSRIITTAFGRAGVPVSRGRADGLGFEDLGDSRWARGDLVRFGPRVSLTGAAPVRRGWTPVHPVVGASVGALARQGYGRLDLLPAVDTVVAAPPTATRPRPWFRSAPAWAVMLWVGAAALIWTRTIVDTPVMAVPDPLVAPAILAGRAADGAMDVITTIETEVRRALRHAPESGRLLISRVRDRVVGPPDWWTIVEVDGRSIAASSSVRTIAEAMRDAGVTLAPEDRILVIPADAPEAGDFTISGVAYAAAEDQSFDLSVPPRVVVPRDAPLRVAPAVLARLGQDGTVRPADTVRPQSYGRIVVERATSFRVVDDGFPFQMRAAATTVEEALGVVGMPLREADTVLPARTAPLANGLKVTVVRDRKSTRLNSSHVKRSRMPSSA